MSDRLGSRGGTVHSLQEAQELQKSVKPDWSERIRASILRTLLARGQWHADDLFADLDLPEAHVNCIGGQTGALVSQGIMREIGRRRPVNSASHGRKSGVYELTDRKSCQRMLTTLVAGWTNAGVGTGAPRPQGAEGLVDPCSASADPGESTTQPGSSPEGDSAGVGGHKSTGPAPVEQLPLTDLPPSRRPLQDPDDPLAA